MIFNLKPYNKESALKLVKFYFDRETKGAKVNTFNGEFEAYELIAKGYSYLYVITRNDIDKLNKSKIILEIKNL